MHACESYHFICFVSTSRLRAQQQWKPIGAVNILSFQFCNPHKWLSNGNWHVSEQRDKKRRKMRLSVRLRSRCTLKSQRQDNTSGLFWWTYLATQQKQYVWCENRALISKCSLCDAPFHYRNDIEIQMWRKIIRCYFLFSLRPLLYLQDATTEIPHIWYIPQR